MSKELTKNAIEGITPREAYQISLEYFKKLYNNDYTNLVLEETEKNKNFWLITMSYVDLIDSQFKEFGYASMLNRHKRKYKEFKINSKTGEVISMKIKTYQQN